MRLAVIRAVNSLFDIIRFLILIDVFASWMLFLQSNKTVAKILNTIHFLVQPIVKPVRNLLAKTPVGNMPIDFSPIIVLLLINFVQNIVITILLLVL